MDWHAAGLRRLDGIIWAIIAAVAGTVLAATVVSDFHRPAFLPCRRCVTTILLAGHWFYRTRRPDRRLANALAITAQIVAFAADIVPAVRGLYLSDFRGLRDGSLRQLIAAGAGRASCCGAARGENLCSGGART